MAPTIRFRFRLSGPDEERLLEAGEGTTAIGRQEGNDWVLAQSQVSRRHAQLHCRAGACQIMDVGSANGTFVNGEKLAPQEPRTLAAGDTIRIGPYELAYEPLAVEPEEAEERVEAESVEAERRKEPAAEEPQPGTPDMPAEPADGGGPGRPAAPAPVEHEPGPEPSPLPGLSPDHSRYLQYLPGIYHTPFMTRFLALLESILSPIESTVDNFDLFLSPATAPATFLPWLSRLYDLSFDDTWSEAQRRTLLAEAPELFARRGTRVALERILEIYLACEVQIDDQDEELEPFTFSVTLPADKRGANRDLIEQLIDAHKPAHTHYRINFR